MDAKQFVHADIGPHTKEIARWEGVPLTVIRLCGAKKGAYENTDLNVSIMYRALPCDVTCPDCKTKFQEMLR
jgi:rubredoxin